MSEEEPTFADQVRSYPDMVLIDQMLELSDTVAGILDGTITDLKWNGHGGSLVILGFHMCAEAERRGWNKDGGWNTQTYPFLKEAQYMMAELGERPTKPTSAEPANRVHVAVKPPVTTSQLVCRGCGRRQGFTNLGTSDRHWWTCANCHRPTELWLRAQGDAVLNKFTDGPLDGMVYTSSTLLNDARLSNLVLGYVYTTEELTSKNTGAIARVWLFQPSQPGSVAQAAQPDVHSSANGKGNTMTQESTETAPVPAPPAEPVNVSDLLATRNRLGLSRTPVSAAAGVTVAQLARIEKGGPRTSAAEAQQVRDALAKLEAEAPAPATTSETDAATAAAGNPA